MRRQCFVALGLALAVLAAPLVAGAQGTRKVPRVGIVSSTSSSVGRHNVDAFRAGLQDLGYIEGHSVVVEERWAEGKPERFGDLIADLLRSNVDVVVVGSAAGALAAKNAATTTPVVFVAVSDPVDIGVVSNLARPGGNMTGVSMAVGPPSPRRAIRSRERG